MEVLGLNDAMQPSSGPCERRTPSTRFWRGKRVFLTGHTGFKGSWLSIWLQSLGAQLQGFSLAPPTTPSLFELARVAEGMSSFSGDIRAGEALNVCMQAFRPDIVLHLAAQPLVGPSYDDPLETYSTNVMGTVNVLEAVRSVETVRVVVNVTTDKCYENRDRRRDFHEDDPMGGHDPYSSSKACSELVTSAYRNSFLRNSGTALASARAGNVIGGGDWTPGRLVPDVLRAFEQGRPALIRSPAAVRPWQHVLEPLSGYLALAEQLWVQSQAFAEGWNFGPRHDDAKPVQWLTSRLAEEWGGGARWECDRNVHPHEAAYLSLDISKARERLGWEPSWDLATALTKTVDWHRACMSGEDMRALCAAQIADYVNSMTLETA